MKESTVVYTRAVSSETSIAEQRQRALEYVTETVGLDEAEVLVLADEGTETRADDSSGYQRLTSLVAAGDVKRVIVTDASRIAKTMPDFYTLLKTLLDSDIAVHVIEAGLALGENRPLAGLESDGSQPSDEAMLRALAIAVDLEESVSAERTKEGIDAAKASGKHVGRPPFGFDSQGGQLVPNEDFETALEVIERIEDGKSKRSTARNAGISRATVQNVVDRKDIYHEYTNAAEAD
ncbi:resolvase [Halobacteriales archaeon QS_3_64_16]|nr:MAG: resolvase [Halobacteriales archaeon QS_3_64_16]